nr:glycosyltransferase [uncultured Friedmanniella sp.]
MPSEGRVGYVVKMYPRFSETFIVTELLAMQTIGVSCEIFSLRPPADARFHASLADVTAPVTYLRSDGLRAAELWSQLRTAAAEFGLAGHVEEVLAVDVRDAAQAVQLALLVRQRGITHLHAHFASVATTVARLAARLAGVTYSLTAHAKDIFHSDVDPADLRKKLADADSVVTVSQFNLKHLQDTFGSDAERVRLVYNGLDLDEFGYQEPVDRPPVIAAVGRLVEKKGFPDLLAALALLRAQGRHELRLDLVGTGLLAEALADQVRDLGLQDVVTLHGALPQTEVRRIIRAAAVVAAPCTVAEDGNRDGLPTVILEAMALGTPVVATPVTGIPEAVTDGATGLLVPERDPAALARALARVLDEPGLASALAKSARTVIEARFDARNQARTVAAGFRLPAFAGAAGQEER